MDLFSLSKLVIIRVYYILQNEANVFLRVEKYSKK